jgi:hypothetical protein
MQGCRRRRACGNCHLPHFFLLFHCHRHHASFPHDHDVPARTMRHNGRFGVEAAKSMAPMPTGMLFLTSLGMHNQLLVHYPPYSYARHNPQQPHNAHQCVGRWWPPWCPNYQRHRTLQSSCMLADFCMWRRRERGTMVAMG